eukprot:s1087_g6.t1
MDPRDSGEPDPSRGGGAHFAASPAQREHSHPNWGRSLAAAPYISRSGARSSQPGFSIVLGNSFYPCRVPLAELVRPTPADEDLRILDRSTPQELESLDLGHLNRLAVGLGSGAGGWTGRARLGRAYRAGVGARLKLAGTCSYTNASPTIDIKNRIYICLRGPLHPEGFWTTSSTRFFQEVRGANGERFAPITVSHAFASQAEATAYLAGASRSWPRCRGGRQGVSGGGRSDSSTSASEPPSLLLLGEDPEWRAVCYVLRCRRNGFGLLLPRDEGVQAALERIVNDDGESMVLFAVREVGVETARRRAAGNIEIFLADLPWAALEHFRRSGGLHLSQGRVLSLEVDGTSVRPNRASTLAAFDQWVSEAGVEDAMQEYVNAEEGHPDEWSRSGRFTARSGQSSQISGPTACSRAGGTGPDTRPLPAGARAAHHGRMANAPQTGRARSQPDRRSREGATGYAGGGRGPASRSRSGSSCFGRGGSGLGCGDAGPTSSPAGHSDLDAAAPVAETFGCSQRSFKRIGQRARQLQQRGPRHTAREAYVRQLEDHATVAQTILENAAAELGVSPTSAPPGLLREFLDKKVALSEHKTLGYLATYLAFQWQAARESRNTEMEAWAGRGVMAIEQMVLDNGRLQIGWLMTGCPEPVFPPNAQLKRQGSMRPFAKLAKPAWAAACLAYVKELDYLEARLKAAREKSTTTTAPTTDVPPTEAKPKAKWKPKNRKPGGAADSES